MRVHVRVLLVQQISFGSRHQKNVQAGKVVSTRKDSTVCVCARAHVRVFVRARVRARVRAHVLMRTHTYVCVCV